MYFNSFPVIPYKNDKDGSLKDVTNLLRRVAVRAKISANTAMFDTYDVREGDTPEIIADRFYEDSELHWIILLLNNVTDRYHQWPMSQPQFQAYVNDKYTNPSGIHHHEIAQTSGDTTIKIEVNDLTTYPTATAITNLEYEEREQDKKRSIKLLNPRFVPDFVDEFKERVKESVI